MFAYDVNGDGQPTWIRRFGGARVWRRLVRTEERTSCATTSSARPERHERRRHHVVLPATQSLGRRCRTATALKDIITGKVFTLIARRRSRRGGRARLITSSAHSRPAGRGDVEPHLVDMEVGWAGAGLSATDFNGDGLVDITVGSKHGVFLFLQQ